MYYPELIFIIPYRNRDNHLRVWIHHMSEILKSYNYSSYEILFIHQQDSKPFNRGAMKNLGFIYAKNKYIESYRNITFIFHDVDVLPLYPETIDYQTQRNIVKHHYGFKFTLGGIFSIKGYDFERIHGFPNFWYWGFEDNVIQNRALRNNLKIDRSKFYKINDSNIIHFYHGKSRIVDNQIVHKKILKTNGLQCLQNYTFSCENIIYNFFMINVIEWDIPEKYEHIKTERLTVFRNIKQNKVNMNNILHIRNNNIIQSKQHTTNIKNTRQNRGNTDNTMNIQNIKDIHNVNIWNNVVSDNIQTHNRFKYTITDFLYEWNIKQILIHDKIQHKKQIIQKFIHEYKLKYYNDIHKPTLCYIQNYNDYTLIKNHQSSVFIFITNIDYFNQNIQLFKKPNFYFVTTNKYIYTILNQTFPKLSFLINIEDGKMVIHNTNENYNEITNDDTNNNISDNVKTHLNHSNIRHNKNIYYIIQDEIHYSNKWVLDYLQERLYFFNFIQFNIYNTNNYNMNHILNTIKDDCLMCIDFTNNTSYNIHYIKKIETTCIKNKIPFISNNRTQAFSWKNKNDIMNYIYYYSDNINLLKHKKYDFEKKELNKKIKHTIDIITYFDNENNYEKYIQNIILLDKIGSYYVNYHCIVDRIQIHNKKTYIDNFKYITNNSSIYIYNIHHLNQSHVYNKILDTICYKKSKYIIFLKPYMLIDDFDLLYETLNKIKTSNITGYVNQAYTINKNYNYNKNYNSTKHTLKNSNTKQISTFKNNKDIEPLIFLYTSQKNEYNKYTYNKSYLSYDFAIFKSDIYTSNKIRFDVNFTNIYFGVLDLCMQFKKNNINIEYNNDLNHCIKQQLGEKYIIDINNRKILDIDYNQTNIQYFLIKLQNDYSNMISHSSIQNFINTKYINNINYKRAIQNYNKSVTLFDSIIDNDFKKKIHSIYFKQSKPVILIFSKSIYPPSGGGEKWLLHMTNILKDDYNFIGICFYDIFKRSRFTDNQVINYASNCNIIQTGFQYEKIFYLQNVFKFQYIFHEGFYRKEVILLSKSLKIPLISCFCFWNDLIEPYTSKKNYLQNDKHKEIIYYENINNNKSICHEIMNVNMINRDYYLCDLFKNNYNNPYINFYLPSQFVYDILIKSSNIQLPIIENISTLNIKKIKCNKGKYVTLLNCHPYKGGIELLYLLEHLDIQIPILGIITEKHNNFHKTIQNAFDKRNKKNHINVLYTSRIEDIEIIYNQSKIILIPSIVDETYCKVAYECKMINKKVVYYDSGNLKYIMKDYKNGYNIKNSIPFNKINNITSETIPEKQKSIMKMLLEQIYYEDTNENIQYENIFNDIFTIRSKINTLLYEAKNKAKTSNLSNINPEILSKTSINKIKNIQVMSNKMDVSLLNKNQSIFNKDVMDIDHTQISNKKINTHYICIYGPFCDQGLGIQMREYYHALKSLGYSVVIYSHVPYHAIQTDPEEWRDYEQYNSIQNRDNPCFEEIMELVTKYNIKTIIIPEICFDGLFKTIIYFKLCGVKVVTPINIEITRWSEIYKHKLIDTILANNYSSYYILNSIFKEQNVKLLQFNNTYIKPKQISKKYSKEGLQQNPIRFCCFGGLNSFFRKNIDIIFDVFRILETRGYLFELNIYIQGNITKNKIHNTIHNTKQIHLFVKNYTYTQLLNIIQMNDIVIHFGDHEGLGLGFYEALNNNKPVITLDTYPNNEYIIHNKNGFIIPCEFEPLKDNNEGIVQKAGVDKNIVLDNMLSILDPDNITNLINTLNHNHIVHNNFINNLKDIIE
jgi:hypothetical protein